MDPQLNEFEIIDIYYADCIQTAGCIPQWSTVRSGKELTDEGSLTKLREQVQTLRKKRMLVYNFGDEIIEVDHPRNESVRLILQHILELPLDLQERDELIQYGDVLARKYLQTPYSRTRLFMVMRVTSNGEVFLFTLVADLNDQPVQQIQQESLNFTSQTILNIYGDLKKGSIYPARVDGQRIENQIKIFDEHDSKYYPTCLECILRLSPEQEARSLVEVIGETCTVTSDQVGRIFRHMRALDQPSFGGNDLVQVLNQNGIEVDQERVNSTWKKHFNYSQYQISPLVLSLETVELSIYIDEFVIRCPINYFPDRIEHRQQGGYHILELRGREYKEIRTGTSRIHVE